MHLHLLLLSSSFFFFFFSFQRQEPRLTCGGTFLCMDLLKVSTSVCPVCFLPCFHWLPFPSLLSCSSLPVAILLANLSRSGLLQSSDISESEYEELKTKWLLRGDFDQKTAASLFDKFGADKESIQHLLKVIED